MLALTANYAAYNYRDSNIGLGLSTRGGPVQFYVMTDNAFAILKPEATKKFAFKFRFEFPNRKSYEYDKSEGEMTIF